MPKITAIKPQKRRTDRVNLYVDEKFWKPAAMNSLVDHNLYAGLDLSEDELIDLGKELDKARAIQVAVEILSHQLRSRSELATRLAKKQNYKTKKREFEDEVIEATLNALAEKGYLNDEHYARMLCQSVMNKKYGRGRARDKLWKVGIDRHEAENIIEEEYPQDKEPGILKESLSRKPAPKTMKDLQRLRAKLMRQGFSSQSINKALSDVDVKDDRSRSEKKIDHEELGLLVKRKYPKADSDFSEKRKALAFMARRGVSYADCSRILDSAFE